MERKFLDSILLLAGLETESIWEIKNGYSSSREDPWYLVQTKWGMITIGWRKRVISIDWSKTPVRKIVTEHDVTKEDYLVHAYSYADAAVYMRTWRLWAENVDATERRRILEAEEDAAREAQGLPALPKTT